MFNINEIRTMFKDLVVSLIPTDKVHFYPLNDIKEHKVQGGYECECNPQIKWNGISRELEIRHNSFDGREYREKDNKKFGKMP